MNEYKIGNFTIYKGNSEPEDKYRTELSQKLIEQFGEQKFSEHDKVREILTFSFNYFIDKFLDVCYNEKSVRFYQLVLSQHEQAIEVAFFAKDQHFPEGITPEYIALYRRILKWILESACDVELQNQEKCDELFVNRAKDVLNDLVFIGDMLFTCATMYAEQDMIEDVAEVIFEDSKYVFKHKHHYDFIIQDIQNSYGTHSFKHVADEKAVDDLQTAIESSFGVKYAYLTTVIQEIHKLNKDKGGQYCGFGWDSLPLSVESMFNADKEQASILYKGLTLHKGNKLNLADLVCKPQTMNRYLYRPILIWNIEGEDFAVLGTNAFKESIIQLTTNAIPWGKAPEEWLKNRQFRKYVHSKEDDHDKWLDDEVEKKLIEGELHYFKNATFVSSEEGDISLIQEGVGEMDFIIFDHSKSKIYIADCKHLQGRYDMMTQKNDFSNFTKGKKPYNTQIENKISWITDNIKALNFHYQKNYGDSNPSIVDYEVKGIFIINTPTFYMFNSDYRIYTVDVVVDIIKGNLVDPSITVVVDNVNETTSFQIDYPYFKKPEYELLDLLNIEDK